MVILITLILMTVLCVDCLTNRVTDYIKLSLLYFA